MRRSTRRSPPAASTTRRATSVPASIDLEGLGLDGGGHLLVEHALAALAPGDRLSVTGRHPQLALHLAAWCRAEGHELDRAAGLITPGTAGADRWRGAG